MHLYPRRQNVAVQVARNATPPMEEERRRKKKKEKYHVVIPLGKQAATEFALASLQISSQNVCGAVSLQISKFARARKFLGEKNVGLHH